MAWTKEIPANPVVAVAGATGAVGREFLEVLHDLDFPASEVRALASSRSAGKILSLRLFPALQGASVPVGARSRLHPSGDQRAADPVAAASEGAGRGRRLPSDPAGAEGAAESVNTGQKPLSIHCVGSAFFFSVFFTGFPLIYTAYCTISM